MLSFDVSHINLDDLYAAFDFVQAMTSNEEAQEAFLNKQKIWRDVLAEEGKKG